jgi:IS30 family transposase
MNIKLHVKARTTPAVRAEIQALKHLSNAEIARRFNISFPTAKRWKEAEDGVFDRSHCPHRIKATLSPAQEAVVVLIREKLRIGLDDLLAVVKEFIEPNMSRSALDRMLRRHQVPSLKALAEAEKERGETPPGKGFKDYEPGFIHVDIKYLPKLEGEASRRYLFVAIDRCTRWVFTHIYDDQTEASSTDFLRRLHAACPVKIVKLLTDNGTQFTDRFRKKDRQPSGQHAFDRTCTELEITHRLIPPRTPQMNGMVALDG